GPRPMPRNRSRDSAAFFFSSRRRHTRFSRDWSSDVCSSDLTHRRNRLRRRPENQTTTVLARKKHFDYTGRRDKLASSHQSISVRRYSVRRFTIVCVVWERTLRSEERRVGKGGRCAARAAA